MLGSQTQKVLQHTTIPGAGVGGGEQLPRAGLRRAARDHPRRAPLARRGDPRPRVSVREARDGGTPPSIPLLRAMLHYINAFPGEAAPPEGGRVPLPQAARAHGASSTTRSTSSSASTSTATRSSPSSSERSTATRPIRAAGSPRFAAAVERFASAQMAAHDARDEGDHAGGAEAPDRRGLGRDRRTRSPRTATRASRSTPTRSSGSCSRGS